MPKTITFVNDILKGIGAYTPSKDFKIIKYASDPDAMYAVYAVFAHWDYERDCIEKWAGIKWIIRQCIILKKPDNNADFKDKFSRWKICILSYETKEYFKSRKINEILLSFENIKYIQTPSKQLNDIKSTIQKLSNVDTEDPDNVNTEDPDPKQFAELLDGIAFYSKLDQYCHDFAGGKKEKDLLTKFERVIQTIPLNIQQTEEDVCNAINAIKKTLKYPKSDAFEEAYKNLYETIKGKLL